MKKLISLNIAGLFAAFILTSGAGQYDDPDGKAGASGAPGETTCSDTDCHNSYAVNSGNGSVSISAPNLVDWTYTPGTTYTISVTVEQAGVNLFGLCFEALKPNGDNAGTLHAGSGTQIKNKTIGGFQRKAITHNNNTGATSNSHTFTFTWDAPATDIGNITFYVAGLAANNDDHESFDYVYNTSQVVSAAALGMENILALRSQFTTFPNPCTHTLGISTEQLPIHIDEVIIFDLQGRKVKSFNSMEQLRKNGQLSLDVNDLGTGTYTIGLLAAGRMVAASQFQKR
ncbi:MAG: choice-of-anchor V domain-containing protein [Flavobacteriales bacterium]|jgi:hypothetical protein